MNTVDSLKNLYKTMTGNDWPYEPNPTDAEVIDKIAKDGTGGGGAGGAGGAALRGKRVSILGDSISTFSGYLTPSTNAVFYPEGNNSPECDVKKVDDTWWKIVLDKAGMVLGANNSYSGRTLINSATTANVQALGANGDPDIILVYLSTNDANQQVTLGTLDTTIPFNVNSSEAGGTETLGTNLTKTQVDALGNSTFYEAARTLIIRLQYYYPKAKIVFLTLAFGSYNRFYSSNPYRDALVAVCELLGVEHIDLRKAGLHQPNLRNYFFQRVHPNKAGMALIGEYVYNRLVALYGNHIAKIDSKIPEDAVLTGLTYTGVPTEEQFEGIGFNPTGLTFTASFSDGSTIPVDAGELEFTPAALGSTPASVTPSYTVNGVTKSATPVQVTTTPTIISDGNYRFAVRNSFSEMKCVSGCTCAIGVPTGQTEVDNTIFKYIDDKRARRRCACGIAKGDHPHPAINGEVLAVTGGSTVHLTASPEGFTHPVDWSCFELDANVHYVPGGIHAEQWLSGDLTLQSDTAYLMITHKPAADTTSTPVNFTTSEINQLPGAALSV